MLLLAVPALAASVGGGVQAAFFDVGMQRLAGMLDGTETTVYEMDLGSAYDCWDRLGVLNFNLTVPVRSVTLEPRGGAADLTVHFDEIRGEGMTLYGTDADYTDSCPEFSTFVYYVSLADAELTASLTVDVDDGRVHFGFDGDPVITGDLTSDIEDFPDDLVLYFLEDAILAELGIAMRETVPPWLDAALGDAVFAGTSGEYSFVIEAVDAAIDADALTLAADGDVGWTGEAACSPGSAPPVGRNPTLDFGDGGGSDFAFGLTEGMLNGLFRGLWEDGWFCFEVNHAEQLVGDLAGLVDPSVGALTASGALLDPPELVVEADGARLLLSGIDVGVTATVDGDTETVVHLAGDAAGTLDVSLDADLGAFVADMRDITFTVGTFETHHLLTPGPDAEGVVKALVEAWLVDWATDAARGIVLFDALYRVYGLVIRLDRVALEAGGIHFAGSFYAEDDPEVDPYAPDTLASASLRDDGAVRVDWSGTDDRAGALAFSYEVDGAGWSTWSTDTFGVVEGISSGAHTIGVKARDAWFNEDPTPVLLEFETEALPAAKGGAGGCGCAGGGPGALVLWVSGTVAVALRRQRRTSLRDQS